MKQLVLMVVLICMHGSAFGVTLSVSCGALGLEMRLCQQAVSAWSEKTGHQVKIVSTPNSSTERFALYQQVLASKSSDIDVIQIDVIWPGTLAPHLVDLSQYIDKGIARQHFPALIKNNTIDGALVAIPWYTAAGVLYYRTDLLEKYKEAPPKTWQQLTETARRIQNLERQSGNPRMQGFVYQAKGYEGLTCDALEWVNSFGGGTIIAANGDVTIQNSQALAALELAASWIGDIAPQGVLNYAEEQSRGVFQSGNAVFMRNWPYAWALGNAPDSAIKNKFAVMALPKGGSMGRHSSVLGGWQLAVSRYSHYPKEAAELVFYLTSYEEQKRRAIEASYNPTITALYQDPDVLAATPFFGDLYQSFKNAVARPSQVTGSKYARVSAEFYYKVHDVLTGKETAAVALQKLQDKLQRLSRGGQW
ncbi:MAG: ABC transporter substrate-binding protein [Pseudomonadales bacterium]|nr:ABC transporter substrate-binding protein [Pseudomonadales bacterium]